MKLVIFGLSISSSWGNGHATLWRGLCRAFIARGHCPVFFERDVPYYAENRDIWQMEGGEIVLYPDWQSALPSARRHLSDADAVILTSYCTDAPAALDLACEYPARRIFYDLDTPATLAALRDHRTINYLGPRGLTDFHLVLSYTGGQAPEELRRRLGAAAVVPLYGSADPDVHYPVPPSEQYQADLSYLGTYAADRQPVLEDLFVEPARSLPEQRFLLGGSQYPNDFPWHPNIYYAGHVAPPLHPQFYCSARLNLSVTRGVMASMGYCPSGRLFEAAACGSPILTDYWEGLENFFEPGREILIASSSAEVCDYLQRPAQELARVGQAARDRVLSEHTAAHRAAQFEAALEQSFSTVQVT